MKKFYALLVFMLFALILTCTKKNQIVGTITETDTGSITGLVVYQSGSGVSGADVVMRNSSLVEKVILASAKKSAIAASAAFTGKTFDSTKTTPAGFFTFTSVDTGHYYVEINDHDTLGALVDAKVTIASPKCVLDTITLKRCGSIIGQLDTSLLGNGACYVSVAELGRKVLVNNNGTYTIPNVPPCSVYTLKLIIDSQYATAALDTTNVNVTAGSITYISIPVPQVPTLTTPANGAIGQSATDTLTWSAVTGATSYHVQVSTSSTFATVLIDDSSLTSASKALGGLPYNTTYYWRVQAKNIRGISSWTSAISFTTIAPPQTPVLNSPVDGATGLLLTDTLKWSAVNAAATYHVQVSTSSTFASVLIEDSSLTSASKVLSGLPNNTTYYWRVLAKNAAGVSGWTSGWSFTTVIAAPSMPTLSSPINGAINQAVSLSLTWNKANSATLYYLQIANDSIFTNIINTDSTLTDTFKVVSGLSNNAKYYWRVKAKNAGGVSEYTSEYSFSTIVAAPQTPVLSSPANGVTGMAITDTLFWSAVTGATCYHVQVSTDSNFSTILIEDSALTVATKILSGLSNNITYYWRVEAKNVGGVSGYTNAYSFTTIELTPFPMGMKLISAAGKNFQMGQAGIADTVHTVTFAKDFYMDSTEVTQIDYVAIMGVNPSKFTSVANGPVENATWFDAVLYCNKRSKRDGKDTVYRYTSIVGTPGNRCTGLTNITTDFTKKGYRLPTEAEREYACRGGTASTYWWGNDTSGLNARAWTAYNSGSTTHSVATTIANAYGLYDMIGNVAEWCNDGLITNPYKYNSTPQTDPTGPSTETGYRIQRGGNWNGIIDFRSADRDNVLLSDDNVTNKYGMGFRCVLPQ